MRSRAQRILESRDLRLFRRMLRVLSDYSTNVPATGVDRLFDIATEKGTGILPKDKHAIAILKYVFSIEPSAAAVHKMLNLRFSDLPAEVKPMAKHERRQIVASWSMDGSVSDRVKDLVDWDATSKQGMWTDIDGKKVEVADTADEEENG